jgi:tetratricopeptide (TPR) repeat protein
VSAEAPTAGATAPAISLRPDAEGRVRELAVRAADAGAAKSLASRGWDRYSQGDLEGAEKLLAQAAAEPGAAPWISYALGFAQIGVKKPQEAARSWERVRAAAPEFEPVYLDLADVYLQLDDSGRALEVLRAAEARWPADSDVLNAVGTVQVRRGSLNDAIEIFGKAIAARPADSLAHLNLARTYELRYYRMRRYSKIDGRWIDNPDDLKRAIDSYERYVKLGGPYENEARAAIERLRWLR